MKCKTTLLTLSSFALFSLVVISCKKSNSSSVSGQITATINGTAWSTNVSTSGIYASISDQFEIIGGSYKSGDTTGVSVSFYDPFPLNTPISSDTSGIDIEYVNQATLAEYDGGIIAGHSLLTITSSDTVNLKISGTFSGVLYNITGGSDSVVVTNGTFTSSYTKQ
jgi:hypothetical protein